MDLSLESRPTLIISGEEDSFGMITNINLGASSILGYHKNDVINKNINAIMPKSYAKYHNYFVKNYLDNFESNIIGRDTLLPAVNKNGYIQMIYLYIRHIPSLVHGIQFIGTFKLEKTLKKVCYMIINKEGQIEYLSTACIQILHLQNKRIKQQSISINDIIESFFFRLDDYKNKHGTDKVIRTFYPNKIVKIHVNVQAQEITFKNYGLQGYLIKIEKLKLKQKSKPQQHHQQLQASAQLPLAQTMTTSHQLYKGSHFELKFEVDTDSYQGRVVQGALNESQLRDQSVFQDLSLSHIQQTNYDTCIIGQKFMQKMEQKSQEILTEQLQEVNVQRIDYSQGIRCLRLFQERLIDIDDLRYEEDEVQQELEENQKNSQEVYGHKNDNANANDLESEMNLNNVFKKQKVFKKFIQRSGFLNNRLISSYKVYAIFCGIIFGVACLINHFVVE